MWNLVSTLGACVIMLVTSIPLANSVHLGQVQSKASSAAAQLHDLDHAAAGYVQANYNAVLAAAPTAIPVTNLVNTGWLPPGFNNQNIFGQSYNIYVTSPSAGNLTLAVTTSGGRAIDEQTAATAAAMSSPEGGYVSSGATNPPGWLVGQNYAVNCSNVSNVCPGAGHLGALVQFNQNAQLSPTQLYRVQVPGQAQLNTMQTNLNMGNNQLTNASKMGVGTASPGAALDVEGGGAIVGTNGASSNTRTMTIMPSGGSQVNFGNYPGAWTSALQVQSNDGSRYVWLSPLDTNSGTNARLVTGGTNLDIAPQDRRMMTVSGGNVVINPDGVASSPILDLQSQSAGPWALRFYRQDLGGGPMLYANSATSLYEQGGLSIGGQFVQNGNNGASISTDMAGGLFANGPNAALYALDRNGNGAGYATYDSGGTLYMTTNEGSRAWGGPFSVSAAGAEQLSGSASQYLFTDTDNQSVNNSIYSQGGAEWLWNNQGGSTVEFPHTGIFGIVTGTGWNNGGAIISQGGDAGLYNTDRNFSGTQNAFYASNGIQYVWNSNYGNTAMFPNAGNEGLAAAATLGGSCASYGYGYFGIDTLGNGVVQCVNNTWQRPGSHSSAVSTPLNAEVGPCNGPCGPIATSNAITIPSTGTWAIFASFSAGVWDAPGAGLIYGFLSTNNCATATAIGGTNLGGSGHNATISGSGAIEIGPQTAGAQISVNLCAAGNSSAGNYYFGTNNGAPLAQEIDLFAVPIS